MEQPQPRTAAARHAPAIRHDGWTGEKMAIFCETLAETAVVAEACDAARMGISGAYAARRRNPVFAAAWDAALSIARERLADTLLARSMEGNVEQIYRDGELVGERHVLDNRLGLANPPPPGSPRRNRLVPTREPASFPRAAAQSKRGAPAILAARQDASTGAWPSMPCARGDDEGVAKALALIEEPALSLSKGDEVEEVEDPLDRPPSACPPDDDEDRGPRSVRSLLAGRGSTTTLDDRLPAARPASTADESRRL